MDLKKLRCIGMSVMTLSSAACGEDVSLRLSESSPQAQGLAASIRFRSCDKNKFTVPPAEGFASDDSTCLSARGQHHAAQDAIELPDSRVTFKGRFGYGVPVAVPLGNEAVDISLDDCTGWQPVAESTTDNLGNVTVTLNAPVDYVGRSNMRYVVTGDATVAEARLYTLPRGTHFVVVDIDGTMTTDDGEYIKQVFMHSAGRDYDPKAFPDAVTLTQNWTKKGYVVMYLTSRPIATADITRAWLQAHGFAAGPLHMSDGPTEFMPSDKGAGAYKLAFLKSMQERGYVFDYAYGNANTDVFAYKGANIAIGHMFTIGKNAGMEGTQPLPPGYTSHLKWVAGQPNAVQPFAF
jgi:phosphatidate phosphatase PAH1